MSNADALERIVASTAEALTGTLAMLAPGAAELTGTVVEDEGATPLGAFEGPVVVARVSYVDGVTGGNLFAIGIDGARALAAAMMGSPAPEPGATELDEIELSAVAEAMNQMMAAAASATSAVLEQEVDISPPDVQVHASASDALGAQDETPHAARVHLKVAGHEAQLVQFVPNAFVVRVNRALDALGGEELPSDAPGGGASAEALGTTISDVPLLLWPELGRTTMRASDLVNLPPGAVVALDHRADDPVDIVVNGLCVAKGRLVVTEGSEWGIHVDELGPHLADQLPKGQVI